MNSQVVADFEELGRGVFESKYNEGKKRHQFFRQQFIDFHRAMSVDRLSYADREILYEVHSDDAARRGSNRQFYGWNSFKAEVVRSIGSSVVPSAATDPRNIWHADVLVSNDPLSKEVLDKYVNEICAESKWELRPVPLPPAVQQVIDQLGSAP